MTNCIRYLLLFAFALGQEINAKEIQDFNFDWKFHLGDIESAYLENYDDSAWTQIRLPHDWAVALPYTKKNAAASTGFKAGGIGWYRKDFELATEDIGKVVWLEFDGIYNNAEVWINGHFVTERPYGYSSFSVPLSANMKAGNNNVAIRVDRSAYADSRWYTGAGIYRSTRLVKASPSHIAQWGVRILTPKVSKKSAEIVIETDIAKPNKKLVLDISILDQAGRVVKKSTRKLKKDRSAKPDKRTLTTRFSLKSPSLWRIDSPHLYTAKIELRDKSTAYDSEKITFGIRSIAFDANKGFLLNGIPTKLKGVNIHHDAGALGVAVPKEIWRYRLEKLRSIGVNGIRLAHNPHSPELLDLCDELGFVAIGEAFDDWERPKAKSVVFLSDNAAKGEAAASYSDHFNQWNESDLKDMIRRDFNHPSIIMWSIGNEVEWTYPYYSESQVYDTKDPDYYDNIPIYNPPRVLENFRRKHYRNGPDNLAEIAKRLSGFVKELDNSRPVTAGLVVPSVGFVTGYTDTLDVIGFNYRAVEYDAAHKTYPHAPIYGAESWGKWSEWKAALDRDFVSGIFVWTGFAYKGEAGPWPRKGLEISFFDFAGNKTPRGHQFESFWVDKPKVYLATIPMEKSEYQYSESKGWIFTERKYHEPKMQWLRPWEWYGVEEKWRYKNKQNILVHVYSNTEESELFLNDVSLGKQKRSDKNERILFWQVPYEAGELKVVGYNQSEPKTSYSLKTYGDVASIELTASKPALKADRYDVSYIHARLLDNEGNLVVAPSRKLHFDIAGPGKLLAVDNGWENSVEPEMANKISTHNGRAAAIIQSSADAGEIQVSVRLTSGLSRSLVINSR